MRRVWFVVAALVAAAVVMPFRATPAPAAPPITGTQIVSETFTGSSVPDPAWAPSGTTCLTGAAAAPPAGSAAIPTCAGKNQGPVPTLGVTPGYLQFTDASVFKAGSILYQRPIPATAGISVTFEQYQYGGNEADGIGFFLVDGATAGSHVERLEHEIGLALSVVADRAGQPAHAFAHVVYRLRVRGCVERFAQRSRGALELGPAVAQLAHPCAEPRVVVRDRGHQPGRVVVARPLLAERGLELLERTTYRMRPTMPGAETRVFRQPLRVHGALRGSGRGLPDSRRTPALDRRARCRRRRSSELP